MRFVIVEETDVDVQRNIRKNMIGDIIEDVCTSCGHTLYKVIVNNQMHMLYDYQVRVLGTTWFVIQPTNI